VGEYMLHFTAVDIKPKTIINTIKRVCSFNKAGKPTVAEMYNHHEAAKIGAILAARSNFDVNMFNSLDSDIIESAKTYSDPDQMKNTTLGIFKFVRWWKNLKS
jgi:hypothetical protein